MAKTNTMAKDSGGGDEKYDQFCSNRKSIEVSSSSMNSYSTTSKNDESEFNATQSPMNFVGTAGI